MGAGITVWDNGLGLFLRLSTYNCHQVEYKLRSQSQHEGANTRGFSTGDKYPYQS